MNTEDKLKDVNAKISQNSDDLASVQVNRDRLFQEQRNLEAMIEAEKNPKLRHGDYGYNIHGNSRVRLNGKTYYEEGEVAGFMEDKLTKIEGNIFDDLKSMQEDVTEFTFTSESDPLLVEVTDIDGIRLSVKGAVIYVYRDEISSFVLKLRQMEATLKRRQK